MGTNDKSLRQLADRLVAASGQMIDAPTGEALTELILVAEELAGSGDIDALAAVGVGLEEAGGPACHQNQVIGRILGAIADAEDLDDGEEDEFDILPPMVEPRSLKKV